MEVRCDKCQARYRVDDARIGPQGLTMRCGKCQNTFKVMKPETQPTAPEQAPVPPAPRPAGAAPRPAAKAAEPAPNATMVFGQAPVAPSKPAMPTAKPAAPAAGKPAAAAKPAAAPAEEGAGRTMMFQTGNIKAPAAKVKPEADSGSTMVFGQSPLAKSAAAPAKPAAKAGDSESGATMVFGQSPIAKAASAPAAKPAVPAKPAPAPVAAPAPEPEAAAPEPASEPAQEHEHDTDSPQEEPAHDDAAPHEEDGGGSGVEAEGAEEGTETESPGQQSTFDKAPPKGLLIGMLAGVVVLVIALAGVVAWKKFSKHPPPQAAVETLTAAQGDADKDTLASIAAAEGKAKDALEVAGPKSYFPQATATLALIDIQWADALNDQANLVTQKGGDGSEAKATELQTQAKAKVKVAFDALAQAMKADKDNKNSPELQSALADYYRAQRSTSTMNKAIKSAQALKADEARLAQVQGMALLQEEDGAEKAIPKLKVALAASPQSARLHFKLALAYLMMKDEANASAELKETLKLSPQHERAKAALEQMAPAPSADGK